MGKKRQITMYDKNAMKEFAKRLGNIRKPLEKSPITDININLDKLERTVKNLPRKERELLEKYWGLIPGTPVKAKMTRNQLMKDVALRNMVIATTEVMNKLLSIEYLREYDRNAEELIRNFYSKMNKKGIEEMSDLDALKYFMLFLVFIAGGEKMVYEQEGNTITREQEKESGYDLYSLIKVSWEATGNKLEDESINMALLVDAVDMFDLKDVIAMKRYVGLPISKEDCDIVTAKLKTFEDIRLFKERLFPYGAWDVTSMLIYSQSIDYIDVSGFEKEMEYFRNNWKKLGKYKTEDVFITTTAGQKVVSNYKIGNLDFTDIYEVMFLYVSRNLI